MRLTKILVLSLATVIFLNINLYSKSRNNLTAVNRNEILNKYQKNKKVQQVICVEFVEKTNAILKMYVRDKSQPTGWKLIVSTDAFIGQFGVGKTKEGDLKTPLGEFNVTSAFGIKPNPGTQLKYIDVTETTYACDEDCKYYNQIIDSEKTGHNCTGEHLIDYSPQYDYGLCLDYNKENIYPRGSGIFIHIKHLYSYTYGGISVDEQSMLTIMKNATKKTKVVIYRSRL